MRKQIGQVFDVGGGFIEQLSVRHLLMRFIPSLHDAEQHSNE